MSGSIAGVLDPHCRSDRARLAGALAPVAAVTELGPLRVAYCGTVARSDEPLCLLAGCLDNAAEIGAELGVSPDAGVERVLAAGYRRWGAGMLPALRGDFALLIWDARRGDGLLARDQLGVRSMYLHESGGVLHFATEVRELLALLSQRPAPDPAGLAHWLAAGGRTDSGTLYRGIRRLVPGGALLLSGDGRTHERRYWTTAFVEPRSHSRAELALQVRESLHRAVRRRLAGPEAATGVLMSGGLDSAAVAAVAAREDPGRVAAFSGVFPDHPDVDESALIGRLRGELGLPGVDAEVRRGGLLASALESQRAWQLPLLSWGDFWTQPLLHAAAQRGVRVMLGGDGGDELFATRAYQLADRLRSGAPGDALALARELPGAGDAPPRAALLRVAAQLALGGAIPYSLHTAARRPFATRRLPRWISRASARELLACDDPLAWKRLDGPRWWAHAAYGLTSGIEQVGIFEMHRHRAASSGMAARHPLFDLDLVQLVLAQPPSSTFDRTYNRPMLRACTSGLLPDAVRLRTRKALFDALVVDTLAGPDNAALRRLFDPRAELGAYIDMAIVRRTLLDDHALCSQHPFAWMQQVWRLATAECWLRSQGDPGGERLREQLGPSAPRVTLRAVDSPAGQRPTAAFA